MGTVKKLYQGQLVGGSGSPGQEVYPVTSTLGVYDTDNNQLQGVLDKVTTNLGLFTCSTAAATAAKTVSASKFVLMEGGSVKIKFTYANSAASPTLAIGTTAAKPIIYNGAEANASNSWEAGEVVEFYYDGTNWVGRTTTPATKEQLNQLGQEVSELPVEKGTGANSAQQKGTGAVASGSDSHAEGLGTTASGESSHAEGLSTEASSYAAHAEGSSTKATKYYSHAEGIATEANGVASHTEGASTTASGDYSHAEGGGISTESPFNVTGPTSGTTDTYETNTEHGLKIGQVVSYNGIYAKIIKIIGDTTFKVDKNLGNLNAVEIQLCLGIAYGRMSHVEGDGTTASGNESHAEGRITIASGLYSHSEGSNNIASGESSHTEGAQTTASANHSHAGGFGSEVSSARGFAHGRNVEAKSNVEGQFAVGKYNKSNTGQIASVGIGTSDNNRKNAFEIMQNGDAYLYGVGNYDGTNPAAATPINQLIGQGGGSTLQITGIYNLYDHEFICTSGHSFDDVKDVLLAGTPVIVDVVVNQDGDNLRYITSDISLLYDSGIWFAISKTFTNGDAIDNWVVQS